MNKDILIKDFPAIFAKDCEMSIGPGWINILYHLCSVIQNHIDNRNTTQVIASQIKEKYGSLSFYYDGGLINEEELDEFITGAVACAIAQSSFVCEECGAPGKKCKPDGFWIKTRCVKHSQFNSKAVPGSISIDFDGVINSYKSGFVAIDDIPDSPVEGSLDFIRSAIDEGFTVHIFSTRNSYESGKRAVYKYLIKHGLEDNYLDKLLFPEAKPIAKVYIDDRAWEFSGVFPELEEIKQFRPWHGGKSSAEKK